MWAALTPVVSHDVGINDVADVPKLVLQVLPGCLPGEVANVAALANTHDTAVLAILFCHTVTAQTPSLPAGRPP